MFSDSSYCDLIDLGRGVRLVDQTLSARQGAITFPLKEARIPIPAIASDVEYYHRVCIRQAVI